MAYDKPDLKVEHLREAVKRLRDNIKILPDNNRKDFHIDVEFLPSTSIGSHVNYIGTDHCIVKIDESQCKRLKFPEWAVIAHEIGHHIAARYNLPKVSRKDLIPSSEIFVMGMENEAWDIAEEMFRVRKDAIRGHQAYFDTTQGFWYKHLYKLRR